jgi:hypothetical protein
MSQFHLEVIYEARTDRRSSSIPAAVQTDPASSFLIGILCILIENQIHMRGKIIYQLLYSIPTSYSKCMRNYCLEETILIQNIPDPLTIDIDLTLTIEPQKYVL